MSWWDNTSSKHHEPDTFHQKSPIFPGEVCFYIYLTKSLTNWDLDDTMTHSYTLERSRLFESWNNHGKALIELRNKVVRSRTQSTRRHILRPHSAAQTATQSATFPWLSCGMRLWDSMKGGLSLWYCEFVILRWWYASGLWYSDVLWIEIVISRWLFRIDSWWRINPQLWMNSIEQISVDWVREIETTVRR